jgi:hypothetical protein
MEKEVHSVFFLANPDSRPINAGALSQFEELCIASVAQAPSAEFHIGAVNIPLGEIPDDDLAIFFAVQEELAKHPREKPVRQIVEQPCGPDQVVFVLRPPL